MTPKLFLSLADALPDPMLLVEQNGRIVAANAAAGDFFRIPPLQLAQQSLASLASNPHDMVEQFLGTWMRSRRPVPLPLQWRHHGQGGWRCQGYLVTPPSQDEQGLVAVRCLTASAAPATAFRRLNKEIASLNSVLRELRRSQELLAIEHEKTLVTLHSIGDAVITTDRDGNVEYLNPVAEELTGWTSEEAHGRPLLDVFHIINEHSREPTDNPVERCLRQGKIIALANDTLLIARNGAEYAIEDSAAPIRTRDGRIFGAILVFRDVTPEKLARRQLEYLAEHDTLTGLYNRHYFERVLETAVREARVGQAQHALLYIDLDQFKLVNDTAGHAFGDMLLSEVARLLGRQLGDQDVLARLGGDEFGVLVRGSNGKQAEQVAANLVHSVAEFRFMAENRAYDVSASIGIAVVDQTIPSAADAMRFADVACYVAKAHGRNTYHAYSQQDDEAVGPMGELNWINTIKEALSAQRFRLVYQPIMDIDKRSVERYEALLRLTSESGEIIYPSAFIPTAERYGLMHNIDSWVIDNALAALRQFQANDRNISLSINISGSSLGNQDLLCSFKESCKRYRVDPSYVVVEITETAAITHLDAATRFMEELKDVGCHFALDDFGTGFSSFAYLKYLPVDYLKIDGTFILDMVNDPVDLAMVTSINEIAHSFGKRTIAEFVESQEILALLKNVGVDYAQGYYVGKPDFQLQ